MFSFSFELNCKILNECTVLFQTTADIAEADRRRRQEFKEYEMQKEFEKQEKLKNLDDEHKQQMLKDIEDKETKHKEHEPVSAVYVVLNIRKKFTPSTTNVVFAVYIIQ